MVGKSTNILHVHNVKDVFTLKVQVNLQCHLGMGKGLLFYVEAQLTKGYNKTQVKVICGNEDISSG